MGVQSPLSSIEVHYKPSKPKLKPMGLKCKYIRKDKDYEMRRMDNLKSIERHKNDHSKRSIYEHHLTAEPCICSENLSIPA